MRPIVNRMADNEAARFVRGLIARSWRLTGAYPGDAPLPALPIALEPGGNYARQGLRISRDGKYVELPELPYMLLAPDESSLSLTFLHEGGTWSIGSCEVPHERNRSGRPSSIRPLR